jgi:hypothetical protein
VIDRCLIVEARALTAVGGPEPVLDRRTEERLRSQPRASLGANLDRSGDVIGYDLLPRTDAQAERERHITQAERDAAKRARQLLASAAARSPDAHGLDGSSGVSSPCRVAGAVIGIAGPVSAFVPSGDLNSVIRRLRFAYA